MRFLIIGTCDTKADELTFLKKQIEDLGHKAAIMDVGVLSRPTFTPDFSNDEVAAASGASRAEIIALGGEDLAMRQMAIGATQIAKNLVLHGKIDGVLAVGGTMGTDLALEVAYGLPLGVPKIIVSSVAHSPLIPIDRLAPDLMVINWAGGVWGLNTACEAVLRQAAGAVVGAATANGGKTLWDRPVVAVSSLGSSSLKYVNHLKPALEDRGFQVIVFHAVGTGGQAMEALVAQGRVSVVLDLCLIEVSNFVNGSPVNAGATRLEAAGRMGVPQIVAPGAIDCLDVIAWHPVPERLKDRPIHNHNRLIGSCKSSLDERKASIDAIVSKLTSAQGPVAFVLPLGGLDEWERPDEALYDPSIPGPFADYVRDLMSDAPFEFHEVCAHINDAEFSVKILSIFDEWLADGRIRRTAGANDRRVVSK